MIRVFILAGTRLYRQGLARVIDADERFRVVGEAEDLAGALAQLGALDPGPDVILLDHAIPEGGGAVRRLHEVAPGLRVLTLAVREAEGDVLPWAEAGVAGFVTRDASLEDLLASVSVAAAGGSLCSPRLAAVLLARVASLAGERRPSSALAELTRREREIALLLEEGLSNKEIALRLRIQVPTVKNHVHSILEKLQVRRRGEAACAVRGESGI